MCVEQLASPLDIFLCIDAASGVQDHMCYDAMARNAACATASEPWAAHGRKCCLRRDFRAMGGPWPQMPHSSKTQALTPKVSALKQNTDFNNWGSNVETEAFLTITAPRRNIHFHDDTHKYIGGVRKDSFTPQKIGVARRAHASLNLWVARRAGQTMGCHDRHTLPQPLVASHLT